MIRSIYRTSLKLVVLGLLSLTACKIKPEDKIIPGWDSEILGPLIKTTIDGSDISFAGNLSANYFFKLADLGFGAAGREFIILPDTTFPPVRYSPVLNKDLISLQLDSGKLSYILVNEMDTDIKKGLEIILSQDGEVLMQDVLREDLKPGNQKYFSKKVSMAGKTIYPKIDLELKNLGTHGSKQIVNIYDKKIGIIINLEHIAVNSIALKPGKYTFSDTSAFNLNGRAVSTQSVSGELIAYIKNQFPFNVNLQFYFMNAVYKKTDSLFTGKETITQSVPGKEEVIIRDTFEVAKSKNINDASFINSNITLSSGEDIVLNKENVMDIQIVGDLKFHVNK